MRDQHLSDEAVAAYADGVLSRGAHERASRHCAACAECRHAVAVQHEAVWALRAAPAPPLPIGLLDRLRDVATTTTITGVPTALGPDGSPMFATYRPIPTPPARAEPTEMRQSRHLRPLLATTAVLAATAAIAAGSAASTATSGAPQPGQIRQGTVDAVHLVTAWLP